MLQKLKEKLFGCAKHLGVFACLYLVTAGLDALVTGTVEPKGLYLFGWTTHNFYCGLWFLSLVLVLLGQNVWARFVTGGNVLAVIVGQFVGDWVEKALPPDPYGTRLHAGFRFWAVLVLVSIFLGGVAQWLRRKA